jgi:hypothetical protein
MISFVENDALPGNTVKRLYLPLMTGTGSDTYPSTWARMVKPSGTGVPFTVAFPEYIKGAIGSPGAANDCPINAKDTATAIATARITWAAFGRSR